ncbi:GNAT family N-acetyltransferase [Chitinophagaceae bacterium MMS25-I14]
MTQKQLYKAICAHKSDLPVFLQYWWLDAVCEEWDVVIAMKGQAVVGVWPYTLQQRLRIDMLRNPQLTPYLGPHIFFPDDIKDTNRDNFEHEVIAQLMEQLPDPDVWLLAIQPGIKQAGIFRDYLLTATVQQTFIIDLAAEESELFANMREPLRRNIRAAEKEITIVNDSRYLSDLYHFQRVTLEDKGKAQHNIYEEMQQLYNVCRKHECTALWCALKDGVVQAIVWNVWDSERSYYFMGAKDPAGDNYKAMSLLLWHAIKEARNRGNRYFDLEGSMDPGVERFFRGFGGKRELYMVLRKNKSVLWRLLEFLRKGS